MLRRHGWSHQVRPGGRWSVTRTGVTGWIKETWPQVEAPRRRTGLARLQKTRPGLDDADEEG
ncbi:hypothetical protein PV350_46125 [Streptomyces sp. PA03-6a]|nr:hypothetical protein [Streptomyces sp. PA03-6a]